MSSEFAPTPRPEQVAHFSTRRYLSIEAITPPDEARWRRDVYDEIIEDDRAVKVRYASTLETRPRRALTMIFHGPRTPPLVRPWRGEA